MAFSTYDADHDLYDDINCVTLSRGGGGNWNNACYNQNLNGQHTSSGGGISCYVLVLFRRQWKYSLTKIIKNDV